TTGTRRKQSRRGWPPPRPQPFNSWPRQQRRLEIGGGLHGSAITLSERILEQRCGGFFGRNLRLGNFRNLIGAAGTRSDLAVGQDVLAFMQRQSLLRPKNFALHPVRNIYKLGRGYRYHSGLAIVESREMACHQ